MLIDSCCSVLSLRKLDFLILSLVLLFCEASSHADELVKQLKLSQVQLNSCKQEIRVWIIAVLSSNALVALYCYCKPKNASSSKWKKHYFEVLKAFFFTSSVDSQTSAGRKRGFWFLTCTQVILDKKRSFFFFNWICTSKSEVDQKN